jgi:hypothetical protein
MYDAIDHVKKFNITLTKKTFVLNNLSFHTENKWTKFIHTKCCD